MRLVMLAAILSALAMPASAQSSHGGGVWSYFGFGGGGSGPHFGDGDRDGGRHFGFGGGRSYFGFGDRDGGRHFSDDHGGRGAALWCWRWKVTRCPPGAAASCRSRPACLGPGLERLWSDPSDAQAQEQRVIDEKVLSFWNGSAGKTMPRVSGSPRGIVRFGARFVAHEHHYGKCLTIR